MRILLLNQFYAPDPAPTAQLLGDLARHLAGIGHRVTVVCARSSYAGLEDSTNGTSEGVEVKRVAGLPFSRAVLARMSSYAAFFVRALGCAIGSARPDLVITLTTPPLLSSAGLLANKLRGARHVIWEMDMYPDALIDVGILAADSLVARIIGWIADVPRRHADAVIALGPCMRDRLVQRGTPPEAIFVAENWADPQIYPRLPLPA